MANCKGMNCNAAEGERHSVECDLKHSAAMADATIQDFGFKNDKEMSDMVAKAVIETKAQADAFKKWQVTDGSKAGLQAFMPAEPTAAMVAFMKQNINFKIVEGGRLAPANRNVIAAVPERCSPVEMRKNLEMVDAFRKEGIDFVAIPALSPAHKNELVCISQGIMEKMIEKAEQR